MTGVLHALCNAHHLRELKALVEIEKEDRGRRMQRLLRRACHAVNLARAQNLPLRPEMIALIERCDAAPPSADGLAYDTLSICPHEGLGTRAHRHVWSASVGRCGSARAKRTRSAS